MQDENKPIESEETFTCGDCKGRFSGEKLRIAKVDDRGVRLVCPECSKKYTDFILKITKLYYWCPRCGKQHYFDLSRTLLLETINYENWSTYGFGYDGCADINVNIKGKIEITAKAKRLKQPSDIVMDEHERVVDA